MSKCYCTKCTVEGIQGEDHLGGDMSGSICSGQVLFLPLNTPPLPPPPDPSLSYIENYCDK